ncbi:hypothetical protein AAMO2058_000915100 [Amorphochlora amoebiformis]
MNTETSYHKRAEGSFVRDPLKFEAAKQARNAAFRRLIILANLVSTVNTTAYFFSALGILNYWRCEIFVVHLIKLLAEVFYNKFGLDLFVHHLCMVLFYVFVPENVLWLGPHGCAIHIPLSFQSLYFLHRSEPNLSRLWSGLFWSMWLPVVAYRNSVAICLGMKYLSVGQSFGQRFLALGALGATLDVFWTKEFLDSQLASSVHRHLCTWAKTVKTFYTSPVCLSLLVLGAYIGHLVVEEPSLPRVPMFIGCLLYICASGFYSARGC